VSDAARTARDQDRRMNLKPIAPILMASALFVSCSASPANPSSDARSRAIAAWRDVTACFRDHGFSAPDAQIDEQGNATFPADTPRVPDDVITACQAVLDRLPNQTGDQGPSAADIQKRRQFAVCMRDHGVAAWPDPDPDGRFPNTPALAAEGKSPTLLAARDACQHILTDGGQ
jgi:hypothetical protein